MKCESLWNCATVYILHRPVDSMAFAYETKVAWQGHFVTLPCHCFAADPLMNMFNKNSSQSQSFRWVSWVLFSQSGNKHLVGWWCQGFGFIDVNRHREKSVCLWRRVPSRTNAIYILCLYNSGHDKLLSRENAMLELCQVVIDVHLLRLSIYIQYVYHQTPFFVYLLKILTLKNFEPIGVPFKFNGA